jgi:DNA-binding MarR family transcriptional regulator
MSASLSDTYRLVVEVRGTFRDLRAVADRYLADLSITAAMRALLEQVADQGPQTVPALAAAKRVQRQSIQTLVDGLIDRGVLEARPNPVHRRSPLIALTAAGERVFAEIRNRDATALARVAENLDGAAVISATATLVALRQALQPLLAEGDAAGVSAGDGR